MDEKCLKAGIFYNEDIYRETLEQPIDVDFSLPDYCPDISKIFKCKAVIRIISKGLNGKNVTIDGNAVITLLYCDKDNNLCSYEYSYPFNKIKEISTETEDANLIVTAKCDYINCRAVSGRKVDIHGSASLCVRVFKRTENQIITDYDAENIQLKRTVAPAAVPVAYCEKYIAVEEEISLGNMQAPVLRILRYDAAPAVKECKIIKDKIIVKGELAVNILYCADKIKAPQVLTSALPFSQIIEMAGISEICKCDVTGETAMLEIKPSNAYDGDCRSFSLNAKLLLKCESYCVNDIEVLEDAYSTKYKTEISKKSLTFNRICENISENCFAKKTVDINENIVSVIDICGEIQSKQVKCENSKITVSGTVLATVIACDKDENILFYEKPLDFEWNYTCVSNENEISFNPWVTVTAIGFTILNANSLELRSELLVAGAVYEKREISLITDMQITDGKPCSCGKKGGMVICFNVEGETLWNIAKKYNASIEEIKQINEIEGEYIGDKKQLLIPIN